ncbi:hypothetical protein CONLIGDRAFT_686842 [Coniochaeta ligniaria NRRL 30616]|uniref:Uncharacterized protein n=1 Tax=Coniochaeta ligniaria NRRL 30616 TaxID=1408157 RepID=A0A1J7IZN2_9PEZI|nr:hypothetical protein CONLIGDRAFT_686842 [Coniochaeta ligniaria NRRL 30616]
MDAADETPELAKARLMLQALQVQTQFLVAELEKMAAGSAAAAATEEDDAEDDDASHRSLGLG